MLQQATEPLMVLNRARPWLFPWKLDQSTTQDLMIPFLIAVSYEIFDDSPEMTLAKGQHSRLSIARSRPTPQRRR